jgi:hypothetical protein
MIHPRQFTLRRLFVLTAVVGVMSAIVAKIGVAQFAIGTLYVLFFVALNAAMIRILSLVARFTQRPDGRPDSAPDRASPPTD